LLKGNRIKEGSCLCTWYFTCLCTWYCNWYCTWYPLAAHIIYI